MDIGFSPRFPIAITIARQTLPVGFKKDLKRGTSKQNEDIKDEVRETVATLLCRGDREEGSVFFFFFLEPRHRQTSEQVVEESRRGRI